MERFLNSHNYTKKLLKGYPQICAYNRFKPECVPLVRRSSPQNRDAALSSCKTPDFLKHLEVFQDETGDYRILPNYIIDQITEAICSINLYPSRLEMQSKGANYILYLKYTNAGLPDSQPSMTTIELEYTFRKSVKVFDGGYFSASIRKDEKLPRYEISKKANLQEELYVFFLDEKLSPACLNVKVQCGAESNLMKLMQQEEAYLVDQLDDVPVCTTLLGAVVSRLFPTRAHFVKFQMDDLLCRGEGDFYKNMCLTSLGWHNLDTNSRASRVNYVNYCLGSKKTHPVMKIKPDAEMTNQAIALLREKYPFLVPDEVKKVGEWEECIVELWERYFGKKISGEAIPNNLSVEFRNNLVNSWFRDPIKHASIVDKFPSVRREIGIKDFKQRLEKLKTMMTMKGHEDFSAPLLPEDVAFFNRIKTPLSRKWRFYLTAPLMSADREMGVAIIKRKLSNVPPTSPIEQINYLDVQGEQLSLMELMKMIKGATEESNDDIERQKKLWQCK